MEVVSFRIQLNLNLEIGYTLLKKMMTKHIKKFHIIPLNQILLTQN